MRRAVRCATPRLILWSGDRGILLSRLFRQLCALVAVTIVVTLQAYGVSNAQHRIEHSLQFPGVDYAEMTAADHDHGHDHEDVDHEDGTSTSDGDASFDTAPTGDAPPMTHHHHAGGDVHLALLTPQHPITDVVARAATLGPLPDALRPGVDDDGPSHPPKQRA